MESSPKQPSGQTGPERAAPPAVPDQATPVGPAPAVPPAGPEQGAMPAVPEQRTAPGTGPNSPAPVRRAARWSRVRLILAVLGGVLALLCLSGLGVGFVLYDKATTPDRSTPNEAADSYLRALLVERDNARAEVFACQDRVGLTAIRGFLAETQQRERELGTEISVNLEDLRVDQSGEESATASVVIRRTATVDGTQQSLTDRWNLALSNEDGWRVCRAERAP